MLKIGISHLSIPWIYLPKLSKWLSCVVSTYLYGAFDCIWYHVTYAFQSKSTLCSCLNIKELLAPNRRDIWSLSDSNGIWTYNHLVHKRTLNHLAKLTKWLSCVVSTYLYGAFDCMFLSCHIRVWGWIYTIQLPECQGTPCSKQVQYLKFKWQQPNLNPQPLSS